MTAIPTGTKFVGIGASVPTPENKSSQNNAFQEVYTIDDIVAEAQDGMQVSPTTTIVNITSAQILAMGNTPIELLPAAGANMYYDIEKVILEFAVGSTAFDNLGLISLFYSSTGANVFSTEADNLIGDLDDLIIKTTASGSYVKGAGEQVFVPSFRKNDSLLLIATDASGTPLDPTLGDGTLRAIITYTVRTFGA